MKEERKILFDFYDEHKHVSFGIRIKGDSEKVTFECVSMFDYDNNEWDVWGESIPTSNFIKAAKQFLETGIGKIDELTIEKENKGIRICLSGLARNITTYHCGYIDWLISDPNRQKCFMEILKKISGETG